MKYEFCPNGNYWEDVSGIFDKETYLYCDCNKCNGKMYKLCVRDVTKKIDAKVIERVKADKTLKEIRLRITKENMEAVKKLIK